MLPSLASMPPLHSNLHHAHATPERTAQPSASTNMRIPALLNPSSSDRNYGGPFRADSPLASAYMQDGRPTPSSPRSEATLAPSNPRRKLVKDNAVFERGAPKGPNNYPPYECNDPRIFESPEQYEEITHHHRQFQIFPSGSAKDGLIRDFPRRIPYSSDKKSFLYKTGKDAFDVYQYTFTLPESADHKEWTVMWDYTNGLVRITPFFKACNHSKTVPAKALGATVGLKELSFSITGGALAAQGYWVPFECARAVCLTFCYEIRWALAPIFGPSFINECIPKGAQGFNRWKIEVEIVRRAALEAEKWRMGLTTCEPAPVATYGQQNIPRSAPEHPTTAEKHNKTRSSKPSFKAGSPFDQPHYIHSPATMESPALSPKSRHAVIQPSGWTSINASPTPEAHLAMPPPMPMPMPVTMAPLHHSLLNQPRYSPTTSWRAADFNARDETPPCLQPWSEEEAIKRTTRKRRSTVVQPSYVEPPSSPLSSERSDDPAPLPAPVAKKRNMSAATRDIKEGAKLWQGPSKFTAEDAAAARLLMSLNAAEAESAKGPNVVRDAQKRRRVGGKS